ncbi:peroxidase family protein [Xanthobacter sp. KR7-225]|uniref:peroxidase family protein n=1 Tax=Xanthobacter sp. KR7-225 TaxID=3156613 RepID=UPI0032B4391C
MKVVKRPQNMDRDHLRPTTRDAIVERVRSLALEAGAQPREQGFSRLFPDLAAPAHRLPEGSRTLDRLLALAEAMAEGEVIDREPRRKCAGDGDLPAAYTYLTAFVLNDLVWQRRPAGLPARPSESAPMECLDLLVNRRAGALDLESIYDAPRDPQDVRRMLLGRVAPAPAGVAGPPRKADANDLPRQPRSLDPGRDRVARVGDPRNDAMLVMSQLHVAFLKAHNTLVGDGLTFQEARLALRERYRWMVLNDLLPRLCDPQVLAAARTRAALGAGARASVPAEFAAAAFVLAPTMARPSYDYNCRYRNVERGALGTRLVLGTAGRGYDALPEHWIIAWEGFLPLEALAPQRARAIDSRIAGAPAAAGTLARRQLLEGYRLGLPTGQAVAAHLGLAPLSGARLLAALPQSQREAAAPFAQATPLWFYILAEAGDPEGPAGVRLGPVGSHIVAATLCGLMGRGLPDTPGRPFDHFTLSDLILLAAEQDLFPPEAAGP